MSCDEVRELLGAYALDAVSPEERAEIEAHLANCGLHVEVASLRAAAFALDPAAPARQPPPELEQRILRAALADRPAAAMSAPSPVALPRTRPWSRLISAPALAAALAVLAIGLGAWVTLLLAADDAAPERFSFSYSGRGGESWLRVESVLGDGPTNVTLGGFDRLGDQSAYHLWAIREERWLRVGFFNINPEGRWAGDFDFSFEAGDEVAVTVGSASGDDRPGGDPLFRSPI